MGEVGCYTLDLYCDHPEHDYYRNQGCKLPVQFAAHTRGGCIRQARREGWTINRKKEGREGSGFALCPLHSKRRKR